MIRNAREYQVTKVQAAKFESALATPPALSTVLIVLEQDAMRSQLADLHAEIKEYERKQPK